MVGEFSGLVLALYNHCGDQQGFQEWAFEEVRRRLQFDSALWLTGTLHNGRHTIYNVHLHRQPPTIISDWAKCPDRDIFTRKVFAAPGKTLTCKVAQELPAELAAHSRRYSVEHIAATTCIQPVSRLNELISFYRADPAQPFTEAERCFIEALVPHLAGTWRYQRLAALARRDAAACATSSALVDDAGLLHAAGPEFLAFMSLEWPGWEGPRLPEDLVACIGTGGRFVGVHLCAQVRGTKQGPVIDVRPAVPADALTDRQKEVAARYCRGDSHKVIAGALGISPATVRNHLALIYQKLNVCSRTELAEQIALTAAELADSETT